MGGAIVINFCGAGTLLGWLLMSPHDLPIRGHDTLVVHRRGGVAGGCGGAGYQVMAGIEGLNRLKKSNSIMNG